MPTGRNSGSIDISAIKYNWRGEWASSGIYSKNDVVRFSGRTYFCKTDALFEQNLFGPEYGPKNLVGATGEGLQASAIAQVSWNLSNTLYLNSPSPTSSNLPIPTTTNLFSEIIKISTASSAWDAHAFSTEFYRESAYCSGMAAETNTNIMFGLNTDPETNANFTSIDFAWYLDVGTLRIYENGSLINSYGPYTTSTVLTITYDGKAVRYWRDGTLVRTVDRPVGLPFHFDSSFLQANATLTNISFGPGDINQYWEEHTEGYLYRGGWMAYREYYPGDVVKLRGDVYLCKARNFNGHPIYKNGLFSSTIGAQVNPDWELIFGGVHTNDDDFVEMLPNMPPLGWTKYRASWHEPGHQRTTLGGRFFTAAGRSYYVGQGNNALNGGSGISGGTTALWMASPAVSMTFDHWDYRFGRLPGYAGQPPKMIQLLGNQYWGCALFDNGEVYHWGYGGHGQNGDGTNNDQVFPVRVGYVNGTHDYRNSGTAAGDLATTRIVKLTGFTSEDNDNTHSLAALDSNGNVWTWGFNGYGQLGHGDYQNRNRPTLINRQHFDGNTIVDVWSNGASEFNSFYAIDTNGQMWAWGYNGFGQLGTGNTRNEPRPVLVKYNFSHFGGVKKVQFFGKNENCAAAVLTNDGTFHACGRNSFTDISGAGIHHMGYIQLFRPYPDIVKGYAQALGKEFKQSGANLDVCRNVDDFWVIGSFAGNDNMIVIKEKNTGLLYGWGYNYSNTLMQSASMWLRPDDSGAYYNRTYFPMPMQLNAPDLTFIGRDQTRGYRTVYYITESGKVYSAGNNFDGDAGWGWFGGETGVFNMMISGQNEWDSMSTTEGSGNNTYFGMRQSERVSIIGGVAGWFNTAATPTPRGSAFVVTESGNLQHIGHHNQYGIAGHVKWGVNTLGGAYNDVYLGLGGLGSFVSPTKVIY
jgi:alpha-tubulin suppressor-like RCC1 family protein